MVANFSSGNFRYCSKKTKIYKNIFQFWSLSSLKAAWGQITWRAPHVAVLLPWSRHLEEGEEAERVPVQVAVGTQGGLLAGRGSAWRVGEAQVVLHL